MVYVVTHKIESSTEVDVQIYTVSKNLNSYSTFGFTYTPLYGSLKT